MPSAPPHDRLRAARRSLGASIAMFALVFSQFIARFRDSRKKALVELKGEWTAAEIRPLVSEIYAAGIQDRIVFASFAFATMHHLVDVALNLPRVIIRRDLQFDPVWLANTAPGT